MKLCRSPLLFVIPALALAAAACEVSKSANPLSPNIAGPIPGVAISAPKLLEPSDGSQFKPKEQPVTLLIENASSTGVRPLYYRIELAADAGFTNILYANPNQAPGDGGRTSVQLPNALSSDRMYYWRARAEDGANTGPYASAQRFQILAPVVIDPPAPVAPVGDATVTTTSPVLRVNNAHRTGPAGSIVYRFELATSQSFSQLVGAVTIPEGPAQTTAGFAGLAYSTRYYWRARASDPDTTSDWSPVVSFVTAAPAPPPAPVPGAPCRASDPLSILQCHRAQYGAHMSDSEVVAFLKGSARDINSAGTAGGPWGLLVKTGGSQCNGYSCDILCMGNGSNQVQRDVLSDSDGAQIPVWGGPMTGSAIVVRTCEIQ
jgi:hypothetical protein